MGGGAVFVNKCEKVCMCICSALQKYWNSKDRITLLAVESRHLQIWLKDEYETKLQNVYTCQTVKGYLVDMWYANSCHMISFNIS